MKYLTLIILCTLSTRSLGQFKGGVRDGQSSGFYSALMNGTGAALFAGGNGDGQSSSYLEVILTINCVSSINVNGNPISPGNYQSLEFISSNGKVNAPTEVIFKTGRSITLQPGFKADLNSIFKAEIDFCISQPINF